MQAVLDQTTHTTPPVLEEDDLNFALLPLSVIRVREGHNPRRKAIREDDPAFIELVESIRANGVIQPITVRRAQDGGYEIVAGERRYRASLFLGLETIPAVIRDMDEETALNAAIVENTARADMTPVEEAEAAHRVLSACDADRNEAARRLGWSTSKLRRRLLLLHACTEVREAFLEEKIELGHVELLSQLPVATQMGTLKAIIENKIPVADLKARIAGFAQELSGAIFDTAGCQGCPHNSAVQAELFATHVGGGRCANRECFSSKTAEALKARKEALAEEYNCVFLDTERHPDDYTMLTRHGENGIGNEQFAACKGCAHFGALLDSRPGHCGKVLEDVCFDLTCHKEKVKAYREMLESEKAGGSGMEGGAAIGASTNGSKSASKAPSKRSTSVKVADMIRDTFVKAATTAMRENHAVVRAMRLQALLNEANGFDAGDLKTDDGNPLSGLINGANRARSIIALVRLGDETARELERRLLLHIVGQKEPMSCGSPMQDSYTKAAIALAKECGIDLGTVFRLDKEFLKGHTKAGIESLMHEARDKDGTPFPEWYNQHKSNDAAFAKLMKRKVDDLIEEILSCGFDFTGFVPACISDEMRKMKLPKPANPGEADNKEGENA